MLASSRRTRQKLQVLLGLFVASFPQRAAAPIGAVDELDVAPPHALQQTRDTFGFGRCRQQVHMIGHEHVSMHGDFVLEAGFAQALQLVAEVVGSGEAGLPIVAALDHVARNTGEIIAWLARHGAPPSVHALLYAILFTPTPFIA